VHIDTGSQSLVIDTGPDFRQQMLREDVQRLHAVLFTHSHKDHTAGLDDVRAYNFLQQIDMPVYGQAYVMKQITTEYAYIFEQHKYPGIPRLKLIPIDEKPFRIGDIDVTPLPVQHLNMPVMGFRIGDFSYITDANAIPQESMDRLKGTKVMVLNALQKEKHISHFNLEEAVGMAQKIGAEKTFFTHLSHKMGLHKAVEAELPSGIALSFDGLTVEL